MKKIIGFVFCFWLTVLPGFGQQCTLCSGNPANILIGGQSVSGFGNVAIGGEEGPVVTSYSAGTGVGGQGLKVSGNNAAAVGGDHVIVSGPDSGAVGGNNTEVAGNESGLVGGRFITLNGSQSFGTGLNFTSNGNQSALFVSATANVTYATDLSVIIHGRSLFVNYGAQKQNKFRVTPSGVFVDGVNLMELISALEARIEELKEI